MKITSIKAQSNAKGRYSVFIDKQYAFSLSGTALLESKLIPGQEVDEAQAELFKQQAADDLLYERALRYASLRMRTQWEVKNYLLRKSASPTLVDNILNKLSNINVINDETYAAAFARDRQLLRPTSRRKIIFDLQKRHIDSEVIKKVAINELEPDTEHSAIQSVITRLRKQSRYKDDLRLMQYLARQGFNYGDIKNALKDLETE